MYIGYLISWLHPILIHFPIALFFCALLAETYGFVRHDEKVANGGKVLLMLGCVISLFAFVSGNFAEVFAVRGGAPHDPVDLHALWAMVTTWCFIGLTVFRFFTPAKPGLFRYQAYLAGLYVSFLLLAYTAHQGGALVFDHGANVLAVHETHALDWKDMRDLYQEQTKESIIYSEMMHHIFGWLVLVVSLFLFAAKLWPERTKAAWKFGPFLLLAGGVFLAIFSDTDSWPLSNARPIYDKEVLQHKIFASLMLAAGAIGLFRKKRNTDAPVSANHHLGLALLALVGGGLLFTHVHSVAPYSNRAIGVYLHHLTIGFFALAAGSSALWEAFVPNGPAWRKYLWSSILIVISILLINYNEGIPRFVQFFNTDPVWKGHDLSYELKLASVPEMITEGKPCELKFRLEDVASKSLPQLEIVHENPLHVMVVSRDLAYFDHVHPILQKDGSLNLSYTFPHGGDFLIFADAKPKTAASTQSYRIPIHVTGVTPSSNAMQENAYKTVEVQNRRVMLFSKPVILAPGVPTHLKFIVSEGTKGVNNLEPYLGCFGHCVVVSENADFYIHAHPEGHDHSQGQAAKSLAQVSAENIPNAESGLPEIGPERQMMLGMGMNSPSMEFSGPEVVFPVTFPKSGLYKVWGQFKHHGEILTAPFVVRVP